MKKILAFGASNSKKSINKTFATFVAHKIENATVTLADLNELELPLFSPDLAAENGIPENAKKFVAMIEAADGIIISLAEHNGMLTAAFKNLWDWSSRVEQKIWKNKPMLLMSTSPGGRGAASALKIAKDIMPHYGGNIIADFSLPLFSQNLQNENIVDEAKASELEEKIKIFQEAI